MSDNDLDYLEELDALEVEEIGEEELSVSADSDENPRLTQSLFADSVFPVVIIDKKLRIIFANQSCDNLFTGFPKVGGNYFIDVFGRAFEMQDIKKIRETVLTGENGYSWKGSALIKSRKTKTVETRVYMFPEHIESKEPEYFVIMFDDVTEENKRLLRAVFLSLLEASKLKDNDTGKHITRVNYYSKRLAEELHFSNNPIYKRIDADYIDNIGFLAAMHDVGKIGTPDDILNKAGPLSEWEWTIMREHTINGGFILSTYPHPMAKDIALCHHERWDGSGYPYKLEGEMIPLSARIVAIADVYDALRMERSYKPALCHEIAKNKILEESSSHFDPALVEVFGNIESDFREIFDNNMDDPSNHPRKKIN